MPHNGVQLAGFVKIRHNGKLVAEGKNLIVDSGLALMAEIFATGGTRPSHMAMGNDGAVSAASMSALVGTESARAAVTATHIGQLVAYEATFGTTLSGTVTVEEYGLFNASASGTLVARFVATPLIVGPSDTLQVEWSFGYGVT